MKIARSLNNFKFQGDSGGPLFIEISPNQYQIFGVVSFGEGCGRGPGVYGKINTAATLDWIMNIVKETNGEFCLDPRFDKKENFL